MDLFFRHSTELAVAYLTAFLVVAFLYAFLASFTPLFYRKKPEHECSYIERMIRSGQATLGQRGTLFWHSVFGSLAVWQCYIVAAGLTAIYWFYWR